MKAIENICKTINDYFSKEREPFPQLNKVLAACSLSKRPGLSVIQSVANITKDLENLGIPTGSMPDGSMNLTVAVAYTVVKEIYRALKMDANVQTFTPSGEEQIVVTVATPSGPATGTGTNVTVSKSDTAIN